jgi:hypothetical protein
MREFATGATRDSDNTKPDYEGFLSPTAIRRYGEYMTQHRKQADGKIRASDNWQKGIPTDAYIKSLFRHFIDAWTINRGIEVFDEKDGHQVFMDEALCAVIFNAMGYLHEITKKDKPIYLCPQCPEVDIFQDSDGF